MHFNVFGCQSNVCWSFVEKNVSDGYIVFVCFGKQHVNLVNPIIDYTSLFISGGLTNARKRRFDRSLMNTEDQMFPHNRLSQHPGYFLNPGCWPAMPHPKSNDQQ
jgi:hypothetical protein